MPGTPPPTSDAHHSDGCCHSACRSWLSLGEAVSSCCSVPVSLWALPNRFPGLDRGAASCQVGVWLNSPHQGWCVLLVHSASTCSGLARVWWLWLTSPNGLSVTGAQFLPCLFTATTSGQSCADRHDDKCWLRRQSSVCKSHRRQFLQQC